jgi:copper chaperone CopZ
MKTENITIMNLSCGGCVNTITKKLTAIAGVEKVEVDLQTNNVLVNHIETVNREQLTQMLLSIGYPEATEKNGLLTLLKSVTSCLTGKLSN